MILKRLRLLNFRSFYGPHEVEFPDNGLLLVRGSSRDHGDSSGSGKSSLLLAISYALGICPFPATVLKSWGAEEDMAVGLTVNLGEPYGEVTINRGTKRTSLDVGGALYTGKNATAMLEKMITLRPEVLAAITYRVQGTRGVFLGMADVEKKEFLTGLLNLGVIEAAIETSEKEIASLQPIIAEKITVIGSVREKLEYMRGLQAPPAPTVGETDPEAVLETLTEERTFLQKSLEARLPYYPSTDLDKMVQGIEFLKTKVVGLRDQDRERQTLAEHNRRAAIGLKECLDRVMNQLADTEKRIAAIKPGECPTCLQPWQNNETYKSNQLGVHYRLCGERDDIKVRIMKMEATKPLSAHIYDKFEPNPEIAKWEEKQGKLGLQYTSTLVQEKATYGERSRAEVERLKVVEAQISQMQARERAAVLARRQRETWITSHNADIAGEEGRLLFVQDTLGRAQKKLGTEQDFLALMGRKGFLGVIFDDVLAEIREEVNSQLSKLANVSSVTLDFVSESITKAGTTKKAIQPVFYVNSHETRFESLSGGMQTSVELVVDLALMTVVQRRTSTLPGFLLLDEAFNGQGTVTKEAALEVLRAYANEKLIIVVDHTSETKEFFSQVIEVVNEGGRSSIA